MAEYEQEAVVVFFRKHNSKIVSFAAVLILTVVGLQWYVSKRHEEQSIGAENFYAYREAFEAWSKQANKISATGELKDAKARLDSLQRLLATSVAPYNEVADLYATIELAQSSQQKAQLEELNKLSVNFVGVEDPRNFEAVFISELKYFVVAKALADSEQYSTKGCSMLQDLIARGSLTAVAAAGIMSELIASKEQHEELVKLVSLLRQRQPWQGDLIQPIESRLKDRGAELAT